MKALTLHQPWASLVALGVKTIETRSWATKYRGPLAIHTGAQRPPLMHLPPLKRDGSWEAQDSHNHQTWLVCDTITDPAYQGPQPTGRRIPKRATTPTLFWPHAGPHHRPREDKPEFTHTEHLPLGAIVATCTLVDVVPMRVHGNAPPFGTKQLTIAADRLWLDAGERGAKDVTDQRPYGDFAPGRYAWLLDGIKPTTERCPRCWGSGEHPTGPSMHACVSCAGRGRCDPIPARGRPGLWEWTATDGEET